MPNAKGLVDVGGSPRHDVLPGRQYSIQLAELETEIHNIVFGERREDARTAWIPWVAPILEDSPACSMTYFCMTERLAEANQWLLAAPGAAPSPRAQQGGTLRYELLCR